MAGTMKSPFKYAGGKRRHTKRILDSIGIKEGDHYLEPFLGGGSIFLALRKSGWAGKATLGELNFDVWTVWSSLRTTIETKIVADDVEEVLEVYFAADEDGQIEFFAALRADEVDGLHPAARVLLLNRLGFNGLMRYNKAGTFNVPRGKVRGPLAGFNRTDLMSVSRALVHTRILYEPANTAISKTKAGDVLYLDPPYLGGFIAYTKEGWDANDHRALVNATHAAILRGARVVVTDSGIPEVWRRWESVGLTVEVLKEHRAINSDGKKRGAVGCIIAYTP